MSTTIPTSFNLPKEFKAYLDSQAKNMNKTRTQYVIDAVSAYASEGKTIYKEQLEILVSLVEKSVNLEKEMQELKTLILQVLKNQQG